MPKKIKNAPLVIPKRKEVAEDALTHIIDPEVLEAYRIELRQARQDSLFPAQDRLAEQIIDLTMKIVDEWEGRCVCPDRTLTREQRIKMLKDMKHTALCQACKRLRWALGLWIDIERLHTERLKLHYGIIRLADKRKPDTPSATMIAADIINSYHAEREKEEDKPIIDVEIDA